MMISRLVIAGFMLWPALACAQLLPISPDFRLPPLRPTVDDVRFSVLDEGYPFKWCPLRIPAGGTFQAYVPATQTCMDAMTEASLQYMLLATRLARRLPNHWNTTDFCLSESQGIVAITSLLNPVYEGNFGNYTGQWSEDWSGSDYSKPKYCAKKIRSFFQYNPGACATAATAPLDQDLLKWLSLKIVNGKCVNNPTPPDANPGPTITWPLWPETSIDKRYKTLGTINYDVKQPDLTPEQLTLLHKTHQCHYEKTVELCGGPVASCSAGAAHLAFEASARNEQEHHFFVMKRFFNDPDPLLTPSERCRIAKLEDFDHMRWMNAVATGSWANARKAENDHQNSHHCMLLKDPRLKVRRTDCGLNVNKCPIETCEQVLARVIP